MCYRLNFKILYHNLRLGQVVVFPVLSMINFLIISYSLTDIQNYLPIEIWIPVVGITLVLLLVGIGSVFKKTQMTTEVNENFFRQTNLVKTLRMILESKDEKEIQEWIEELKKHES